MTKVENQKIIKRDLEKNGKDIHEDFGKNPNLVVNGMRGEINYEECEKWINIGLKPIDDDFCNGLKNNKQIDVEQALESKDSEDGGRDLRKQYRKGVKEDIEKLEKERAEKWLKEPSEIKTNEIGCFTCLKEIYKRDKKKKGDKFCLEHGKKCEWENCSNIISCSSREKYCFFCTGDKSKKIKCKGNDCEEIVCLADEYCYSHFPHFCQHSKCFKKVIGNKNLYCNKHTDPNNRKDDCSCSGIKTVSEKIYIGGYRRDGLRIFSYECEKKDCSEITHRKNSYCGKHACELVEMIQTLLGIDLDNLEKGLKNEVGDIGDIKRGKLEREIMQEHNKTKDRGGLEREISLEIEKRKMVERERDEERKRREEVEKENKEGREKLKVAEEDKKLKAQLEANIETKTYKI